MKRDDGQSLIETAIAVPLLLLILIGIFDVGRVMHYTIAIEAGAREGAAYAASSATPSDAATLQRVCDAAGLGPLGSPCLGLDVTATRADQRQNVVVTYDVQLFYARLLGPLGASNPMRIRTVASYPVVGR